MAAIAAIDRRDPIARQPEQAAQFRRRDLALLAHAFRVGERGEAELAGAGQRLVALGIDAVVLHGELLEAEDAAAAEALIRGLLGEPVASVGQGRAWALEGAP